MPKQRKNTTLRVKLNNLLEALQDDVLTLESVLHGLKGPAMCEAVTSRIAEAKREVQVVKEIIAEL
jgi:hypothetical protein